MKLMHTGRASAAAAAILAVAAVVTLVRAAPPSRSPIHGVTLPQQYRQWELVAPALEAAPLNELRAVLGNRVAIEAHGNGTLPFPDGAVLVKLVWRVQSSRESDPASIPGEPTTVQVMVKDSRRYTASGGWGFGRFIDGVAVDEAQHETCFACHDARVRSHDFVFTRWAR